MNLFGNGSANPDPRRDAMRDTVAILEAFVARDEKAFEAIANHAVTVDLLYSFAGLIAANVTTQGQDFDEFVKFMRGMVNLTDGRVS